MIQLLLANDVLQELEDRRELSLSGLIVAFQRHCRKYLANRWLEKRRVLETAIKCIQVRKFARKKRSSNRNEFRKMVEFT